MKNYKIDAYVRVNLDDFEQGELEQVNEFPLNEHIKADTPEDALVEFMKRCNYDDSAKIELFDFENVRCPEILVQVDIDNNEACASDVELWKKGEVKLYNASFGFDVYEETSVVFNPAK